MKLIKQPKLSDELEMLTIKIDGKRKEVLYYEDGVQAGFPSPADDFLEQRLSLDEKYLNNPESTYLIRVKGVSMYPTLHKKDLLVVKSNFKLENNDIAILSVNNTEYTVKRYDAMKNELIADNDKFDNIKINPDDTVICLGIVKHLVRDLC